VARRVVVVSVVALSVLSLALPIASAAVKPGRLGIGDSVMAGARAELRERFFRVVDTATSRQFSAADDRVRYWKSRGKLPKNVVIHLGNNGYVQPTDCNAAVRAVGSARNVFLVTLKVPRFYRATNNDRLRACANRFPHAHLIDWFSYSKSHGAWFYADGFHLTPTGQRAYAAYVVRRIKALS
jgi:hypothetical protein